MTDVEALVDTALMKIQLCESVMKTLIPIMASLLEAIHIFQET
jgi:hypothetical protein